MPKIGVKVGSKESLSARFEVIRIKRILAKNLVMKHHYSGRMPGAVEAWGLKENGKIVGCIVYSIPASYTLCKGVCGEEYRKDVLELSRLVILTKTKNAASYLIGNSLKLIKRNRNAIIVSYADCNDHVGHVGYVYQATNWIYTGQGSAEPAWADPRTGKIISYTRRHIDVKAKALGLIWEGGDKNIPLTRIKQKGKHRYVMIVGTRDYRRQALQKLRYPVLPYPKGDTKRHVTKAEIPNIL